MEWMEDRMDGMDWNETNGNGFPPGRNGMKGDHGSENGMEMNGME
jgi:hypothetical protein